MARLKIFPQKMIFEIRFDLRPSMLTGAGLLADRWVKDHPGVEIDLPRYQLKNLDRRQIFIATMNSAIIEVEDQHDFQQFVQLAKRLTQDVKEVLLPDKIVRLGFRQYVLTSEEPFSRARATIMQTFFSPKFPWIEAEGRDKISDIGLVLEFMAQPHVQGKISFGPFVLEANQGMFLFREALRSIKDGFIFDADYGESDVLIDMLEEKQIEQWLSVGNRVTRERITKILQAMDYEVTQ